jgi:hypothetical protein
VPSDNYEKDETVGASAVTPSLSAPRIGRELPLAATFSAGDVLAGRFRIVRFTMRQRRSRPVDPFPEPP